MLVNVREFKDHFEYHALSNPDSDNIASWDVTAGHYSHTVKTELYW